MTSRTMMRRWHEHVCKAKRPTGGSGWYFPNAIRKYGKDAFSHEVLETCDTLEAANLAEQEWIEKLGTRDPVMGFNLARGGSHVPVDPATLADRRAVASAFMKTKWADPTYRSSMLEKMQSPESRAMASVSVTGRKLSDEVRSNLSKVNSGKFFSQETRQKISASLKGHVMSEETCRKISNSMKGKVVPPDVRAKIASSNTGRFHTPEAKLRMSVIQKKKALERSSNKVA